MSHASVVLPQLINGKKTSRRHSDIDDTAFALSLVKGGGEPSQNPHIPTELPEGYDEFCDAEPDEDTIRCICGMCK